VVGVVLVFLALTILIMFSLYLNSTKLKY